MNVNIRVVKAVAGANTEEQLQAIIKEQAAALAENEVIISASTGAAASYAMKERNRLTDLLDLYSMALEYKQTGRVDALSTLTPVTVAKLYL